jgi:hypothetical protein
MKNGGTLRLCLPSCPESTWWYNNSFCMCSIESWTLDSATVTIVRRTRNGQDISELLCPAKEYEAVVSGWPWLGPGAISPSTRRWSEFSHSRCHGISSSNHLWAFGDSGLGPGTLRWTAYQIIKTDLQPLDSLMYCSSCRPCNHLVERTVARITLNMMYIWAGRCTMQLSIRTRVNIDVWRAASNISQSWQIYNLHKYWVVK